MEKIRGENFGKWFHFLPSLFFSIAHKRERERLRKNNRSIMGSGEHGEDDETTAYDEAAFDASLCRLQKSKSRSGGKNHSSSMGTRSRSRENNNVTSPTWYEQEQQQYEEAVVKHQQRIKAATREERSSKATAGGVTTSIVSAKKEEAAATSMSAKKAAIKKKKVREGQEQHRLASLSVDKNNRSKRSSTTATEKNAEGKDPKQLKPRVSKARATTVNATPQPADATKDKNSFGTSSKRSEQLPGSSSSGRRKYKELLRKNKIARRKAESKEGLSAVLEEASSMDRSIISNTSLISQLDINNNAKHNASILSGTIGSCFCVAAQKRPASTSTARNGGRVVANVMLDENGVLRTCDSHTATTADAEWSSSSSSSDDDDDDDDASTSSILPDEIGSALMGALDDMTRSLTFVLSAMTYWKKANNNSKDTTTAATAPDATATTTTTQAAAVASKSKRRAKDVVQENRRRQHKSSSSIKRRSASVRKSS
jgi:hypothetical protein